MTSTLDLPGIDLDRRVGVVLNGEAKERPPAYSTSPLTASRLLARLGGMGFRVDLEESGGIWYCTMSLANERVSSGSAGTREHALARAVVHCRRWAAPAAPSANAGATIRPRRFILPPRPSARQTLSCLDCGEYFTAQRNPKVKPLCNTCSWRRLSRERRKPSLSVKAQA